MTKILYSLVICVIFLAACGADPKITVRVIPSPTPLVWEALPEPVREFLQNETVEEALAWMEASEWQYVEVDGLPPGSVNASPSVSLAQKRGECFETAAIFSLLAMKRGDTPYLLHIIQGETINHDIHLFQDSTSGKWGYVDYPDYTSAEFGSVMKAIESYLENIRTRIVEDLPVEWMMIDWQAFADRGVDWVTTGGDLEIYSHYAETSGTYNYK